MASGDNPTSTLEMLDEPSAGRLTIQEFPKIPNTHPQIPMCFKESH